MFTSLWRHQCDQLVDFDFSGKTLIELVFSKSIAFMAYSIFHFSYVFLYFVGIMLVCLNKN